MFLYVLVLLLLFSHQVMSDSLPPHGLQHARHPCPSPPRVSSDSCPLSWWCCLTISSSVILFASCLQSFLVSRSFLTSQLFASGGQSFGVSASAVLSMNIQGWFHLGLTGFISLLSKGLSKSLLQHHGQKSQFFGTQPFIWSNTHIHTWLLKKQLLWLYRPLSAKWCLWFLICCLAFSSPHSSALAWKIPWTEEPGRLRSMGLRRVRHDWSTSLSLFTLMLWRRKWQPTPVFLPGES